MSKNLSGVPLKLIIRAIQKLAYLQSQTDNVVADGQNVKIQ
jgi:hypothetical protein